MESFEVTKLSSKGQIVLPQAIREKLHLVAGARFVVLGSQDTVILKKLEEPDREQVRALLKASRAYAKRVGLTPADVKKAIRDVRSKSK